MIVRKVVNPYDNLNQYDNLTIGYYRSIRKYKFEDLRMIGLPI
jgi:hypothetical protein